MERSTKYATRELFRSTAPIIPPTTVGLRHFAGEQRPGRRLADLHLLINCWLDLVEMTVGWLMSLICLVLEVSNMIW